jgi:hypothetical protein
MAARDQKEFRSVRGDSITSTTLNSVTTFSDQHSCPSPNEEAMRRLTPEVSRVSAVSGLSRKATSIGTTDTSDPQYEIDWEGDEDHENPRNWPIWYKGLTIGFVSWSTWV